MSGKPSAFAGLNKGAVTFLQAVVVLVGIAALAFMLWEPHLEGRNARATLFEIYFKDPFLAYAYLASVPFFAALYQGFKALGFIGRGEAFSPAAAKALRIMRYCALSLIGFVALGELFILSADGDDRAGGVFMGLLVSFGAVALAAAAAALERVLSGNDSKTPEAT